MIYDVDNNREYLSIKTKAKWGDTIHFGPGERYTSIVHNMDGVKLDGDHAIIDGSGVSYGVLVKADHSSVSGFRIINSKGSGISVQNSEHVTITGNHPFNNRNGIRAGHSDDVKIKGNRVHDNGDHKGGAGISIHVAKEYGKVGGITVEANLVYDNFTLDDTEGWGVIADGQFVNNPGSFTDYSFLVKIVNNKIWGNDASGILSFGYKNVLISGNTVEDNNQVRNSGEIQLRFTDKAVVKDNIVDGHSTFDYVVRHTKKMVLDWEFDFKDSIDLRIVGHSQPLPNGGMGIGDYYDYHPHVQAHELDW